MNIEDVLVKKISSILYKGTSNNEREVIEYGLALFIESFVKTIVILLFATMINKVYETIVFLCMFCLIRTNAGGFHCKSNFGCTSSVFLIYLSALALNNIRIHNVVIMLSGLLCLLVCLIFAPSSTNNNPIFDLKIRTRKKISCFFLIIVYYLNFRYQIVHVASGYVFVTYISIIILVTLLEGVRLWQRKSKLKNLYAK